MSTLPIPTSGARYRYCPTVCGGCYWRGSSIASNNGGCCGSPDWAPGERPIERLAAINEALAGPLPRRDADELVHQRARQEAFIAVTFDRR